MTTIRVLVGCLLLAPATFGAAKCKVDGVGEGVIISEPHVILNFKGDPVVIYVDACKIGSSIYRAGYKLMSMRLVDLTDRVDASCAGPLCRVPGSGVASLRHLRAQLAGAAGRPAQPVDWQVRPGAPDIRAVIGEMDAALARCPAQGDCQVPAAMFAALQPRVATEASGNRSVQQFIAARQQTAVGGAVLNTAATNAAAIGGCPPRCQFSGAVQGIRSPGALVGLKHGPSNRILVSVPLPAAGAFTLPALPAGSPPGPYQVCIALREPQGMKGYCGPPGNASPDIATPAGAVQVRGAFR